MAETLETAGQYRVRLEIDPDPQNPRTSQDNLCHVITVRHSHYIDVEGSGGPLEDGWDRVKDRQDAVAVFTRWARIFRGAVVQYNTPQKGPDSIWYLTPDEISEVPDADECIRIEIEEYQNWVDGDVYGYIIEKAVDWVRKDGADDTMFTWEDVESCWGFVGYDHAKQSALEEFAPYRGKPTVNVSPVAGANDTAGELTIEYSGGARDSAGMQPGGLIGFSTTDSGLNVNLYRHDDTVQIAIHGAYSPPRSKPRLIVNAGDVADLYRAMQNDLPYPLRLADGTEIEVSAGDPSTGEIGREHAHMDELRVTN